MVGHINGLARRLPAKRASALAAPCGGAVLVLLCAGPAFAQSYSLSNGTTVLDANTIADVNGAATVTVSGGSTLILSGTNSYSGGTTVNGNSILGISSNGNLGAAAGSLTLGDSSKSGTLALGNSTALTSALAIIVNAGGGAISANASPLVTFNGVVSGTGALTIGGGGTIALTGANTYGGGTNIIGNSTVQVTSDGNLGASSTVTLGAPGISGGTLSWTNTAALTSGRYVVLSAGGGTTGGGTILVNNSTGTAATTAVTLSGLISGTGNLTVGGGGNLILTGANSYTGSTTVNGGAMLSINGDGALGTVTTTTTLGVTTTTAGPVSLDNGTLQFNAGFSSTRAVTLAANGGTFDTDGNNNTLTGVISNFQSGIAGNLTKVGTGTLTLDGVNTYTGTTTVSGGTLQIGDAGTTTASIQGPVTVNSGATLSGDGSVGGAVDNSGTVYSGVSSSKGLSVGSYKQESTGTLSVLMTPSGAATLKVGGAASLAGTLTVSYGTGFLKAGTYQLLTASSISGGFSTITNVVPSVGLSGSVKENANGTEIDLTLVQLSTLPDHPTVFTALSSAAVDEAQRANGTVLAHMVNVRNSAAADDMTAAWSSSHRVVSASPYGYWFQPTGNFGSTTSKGSAPGFDTVGGGFLTGLDTELARGLSGGFAFGYNRTNVDENGGASGTIDVPRFVAYGSWWTGPFALDTVLGYGYASFNGTRPIASAGEVAKSSYSGNELSASLQASLGYSLDGWAISPAAGVKFLSLSQGQFTEKGTDIYNYTVRSNTLNSARPFIDTTVSHHFKIGDNSALVPKLTVGYEEEVSSTNRNINVMTEGDNTIWRITGTPQSRGSASVDAGLTLETSKSEGIYIDYERTQSSSTTNQSFTAGLRYRL